MPCFSPGGTISRCAITTSSRSSRSDGASTYCSRCKRPAPRACTSCTGSPACRRAASSGSCTTLNGRGLVHQRLADGAFLTSHTLARRSHDDAAWLVETAGPALQELGRRVLWPAILSVPRPDHMETVDAVRTRHAGAYFDDYPIPPIGFRSDLLRGASGRAYLAWCPDRERAAVLLRLGEHDPAARDAAAVSRLVDTTRARGYSIRDAGYGGAHTGTGLAHAAGTGDDGRSSIALPILLDGTCSAVST